MVKPSEVNLHQELFINNFNLLAKVCKKLGEPIEKINSTGLCCGLAKKRLFDAYQAKGGELPEFDAYMAYINHLTPKSIQALGNEYKTKKNFEIEVVAGYKLTFRGLLKFAQSVNQAQKLQHIAPFKSFAANWDNSVSFVCKKSCLPEFLALCQFDTFDLLHFSAGHHAFAKPYSTIYDANSREKTWVFSTAGKTRSEQAVGVASIINEKILADNTHSDYIALCLNSLSYGNAHRELVDLLNENRSLIQQQQPSLLSYIEDCERGNLSRMQLALVLNEAIDPDNPDLIKLKNELSRICSQQIITIEKLITLAGDINAQDSNGYSWLWLVARYNQITWAKALINAGAKIDAHAKDGSTPLFSASQNGHIEIVQLLEAAGAKIDAPTREGATPLLIAAENGHLKIVELLVDKGAEINKSRTDGATPLYFAAQNGYLEIVKLLVAKGAKINGTDGAIPLLIAAEKGHLEIVKLLVAKGARIDAEADIDDITPLYVASQNKQLETVKFLLEHGADINAVCGEDGFTPFHIAVFNRDISMVTFLLKKGADINEPLKNGTTPLETASCKGHTEIKQLIEQHKNAQAVLLQAHAKIKPADSVAAKISEVFSAFAHPPMFSMIWRNGQEKKCAATIAKILSENPAWSFNDCKRYVTDTVESIKADQWSVLAGLLKQLDKFAPEQAVSSQKNNSNAI